MWFCIKCSKNEVEAAEHTCSECRNEKPKKRNVKLIVCWTAIGLAIAYAITTIVLVGVGGVF